MLTTGARPLQKTAPVAGPAGKGRGSTERRWSSVHQEQALARPPAVARVGGCGHAGDGTCHVHQHGRLWSSRTPSYTEQLEGLAFFGLSPDQCDLLSDMLNNFLDSVRRAQNAVIHYLLLPSNPEARSAG
jgi:hypothetical protein